MRLRADICEGSASEAIDRLRVDLSQLEGRRASLDRYSTIIGLLASWFPPFDAIERDTSLTLARLDAAIDDRREWMNPDRRILSYDSSGDGRIIEVLGDLEAARHIVILVPGVGTDLSSYERTLHEDALHVAERLGDRSAAVVAWLDYDPPDSVLAAVSTEPAHDGAAALTAFVSSLPPAHTTVIGHSYGSLVVGLAAREQGLEADELVFIGSPGVGAENASDLDVPASTAVWAALTPLDPIQLARPECILLSEGCFSSSDLIFGVDPHAPSFGARTFSTGGTSVWSAHSAYYEPGSPSLDNLVHIVLGEDSQVE